MALIQSFEAKTDSFPNRIRVSWVLTEPLGVNEEVNIRRQESIYPLSTEGALVFTTTDSAILTFVDKDLSDNLYFYYSVFIKNTTTGVFSELTPITRDFAISYKDWGEGPRLFGLLPPGIQDNDTSLNPDGTPRFGAHLQKLTLSIGNTMDYYRTLVCAMAYFRRPELIAETLLDFYSEMFGFAPERGFDLRVLRNMALSLIAIYKIKGTCQGLSKFTKAFTTWDSICDDSIDLTFRTWDGTSKRHFSYLTSVTTNQAVDSNANFTANIWTNGKFVDPGDDPFYTILGNDSTTITFGTKTPPFNRLDGTDGEGINSVTFQDLTQTWTINQWKGHRLFIDSFSTTKYYVVVSNTSDTLILNLMFTNFGSPEVYQQVGVDIIASLPTAYRIEPEYYVQTGRHSLTYDNTVPAGFRGLTKDPAHFLIGGSRSLLSLGQFSPQSVILIIQGVANFVGRSTTLTPTVLTDTNANFGSVNGLVGKKINPNILQAEDFEIIANDASTITIDGDMIEVAGVGNNYFILNQSDSIKAKRLRQVLPEFIPYYAQVFLFFEPI